MIPAMLQEPIPSAETASSPGWRFDHSYSCLPRPLWDAPALSPVSEPRLAILNRSLCEEMGLDPEGLARPDQVEALAGNRVPEGGFALAQAYSGHQFGHFTTLGDGRAMLLGEHLTPDGRRLDVQLKGSGPTRFSRGGDGRAPLGPMLREYVISEAMHELGIPTTRSLAVVETGDPVFRETPLPGAVLTRVASSHIRVGTFQFAAAQRQPALLQALVATTIERHFPDLAEADEPATELLRCVAELQADLIARWLAVGFIHGVMNTDNMTLAGETIDYGPCAFLEAYHPDTVFSSIDRGGRYAFGQQAGIALWNLARFAEALLPILDEVPERAVERAQETVDAFPDLFQPQRIGCDAGETGARRRGAGRRGAGLRPALAHGRAPDRLHQRFPGSDRRTTPGGRRGVPRLDGSPGRLGSPASRARSRRGFLRMQAANPDRDPPQPPGGGGSVRRLGAERLRAVPSPARRAGRSVRSRPRTTRI